MTSSVRRPSKARREWVPTRRCPCGGRFFHDVQPYSNHGVFFGHYVFWTCDKCGETVVPPSTSETLDQVAKAKGLFGLEAEGPAHPVHVGRPVKAHA